MIDIRELRIGQTVRFDQGFGTIEGLRSTRYMEWDTGDKTGTVTVRDVSGVYYLCDLEEISIPLTGRDRRIPQSGGRHKERFLRK